MKNLKKQLAGLGILLFGLVMLTFIGCPSPGGGTPTQYWTVTFDLNGGTSDPITDIQVERGKTMGKQYPTDPSRTGSWGFGGWFDESVDPSVEYKDNTPITKDLTLKAKWNSTDSTKWVVSFNTDGGGTIADIQVPKGEAMGDLYPTDPTKARHKFDGWYLASDTGFSGTKYEKNTPTITTDTDLKAKWKSTDIIIEIEMKNNEGDDSVTASPESGQIRETITISYTLAGTKANNRLAFSGTNPAFSEVDSSGTTNKSGTITYTINAEDAKDGIITIIATFTHSNKTLDSIAFANDVLSGVGKTYGDASFTLAVTTTGSGTGAITYASSEETIATVNATTGEVTILKVGSATITATKAEDATYSGATASYVLTVAQLQLTIADPTLTATKTYDGNATAAVTAGALANVKSGDTVTVIAAANYNSANAAEANLITVVYTISGENAGNYIKPVNYTIPGTISKIQLTIGNPTVTTSKSYNGDTIAAVTALGTLSGKIEGETVNVTAAANYNSANAAEANLITVVYTISGADEANYIKPDNYTIAGTISKATGRTVTTPTVASRTASSLTVNAVTLQSPNYGQVAEYAAATTTTTPSADWTTELTISGLTADTAYYVFARSKGDNNCNEGAVVRSTTTTKTTITDDVNRMVVVNFEDDVLGKTYTGNASSRVVVADPANSSQKSLQINCTNYGQYVLVPIYLPVALSNYGSFMFRFRLANPAGGDLNTKDIRVYAAQSGAAWDQLNNLVQNPSASLNISTNSHQNTWTDISLTIANPPNNAIKDLQGLIYLTIGINAGTSGINYLVDDLTFVMRNGVPTPGPSISPTTATFDKKPAAQADIPVTMTPRGKTFTNITNGGIPLTSGTHYTLSGSTVTLLASYLAAQTDGLTTLTFNFSDATTATIVITISDSTNAPTTVTSYDFTNGNNPFALPGAATPRGGGSTQALVDTVTWKVENNALSVSRTSNNNTAWLWVPFNTGTDPISQYKSVEIMWKSGTGDMSSKPINIYLNTNTSTGGNPPSAVLNANSIGNLSNGTNNASSFVTKTVTISTTSTLSGAIEIGIGVGQTNNSGANFEIQSIVLKK